MDTKNNTGIENSGDWNSGYRNSGDLNSGNRNSGDLNSGNRNSGDLNSGDWNSGNRNSGDWNSGDWNSGDWNSGNRNSGDLNSGNRNSGDWNSGNRNSGYFNSDEPDKVRVFNTWLDMKPSEFLDKYNIYADIPLNRWVALADMTDDEKKSVKGCTEMGGYLKTLPFHEACQVWWKENPTEHERFLSLPNFNAAIFKDITGIDVTEDDDVSKAIALLEKKGRIKDGKIIV